MAKNVGNYIEFWFGGREYPVEAVEYNVEYAELDTTDSSTETDATETVLNRAKRTLKVDGLLSEALGAEVVTGTAVAGTAYLVTGGTITETGGTYTLGMIFVSDGTGTLSGTNKVKPLGAKLLGKNIACSVGGVSTAVVSLKYSEEYGEYDVTDSGSPTDTMEWITGRARRFGSLELIQSTTAADLLVASPSAVALVLTLGSGLTLTGSAMFKKKGAVGSAKGDAVKVAYDVNWVGAVTSTLEDVLTPAVSTAVKAIWKRGASTNKEATGNALVMSTSIEADVNGLVRVSYNLSFSGAVTEAVAN